MVVYFALLLAVGFERIAELLVAKRNAAWSTARGGVETGRGHYPVMVVLHTGLLAGCLVEPLLAHRSFVPALGWTMIVIELAAQGLRWWCIATLGPRWNTRVIVVPGLPLVRSGPYRYLNHPNYVAVVVEGVALPLAGSAWITAVAFSCLNAALLTVRLRCETRALATVLGSSDLGGVGVGTGVGTGPEAA
ncbi:MAG TPA: isoprenylcysteine carboxyl methyltransferase family protein [Actinocrinis sp.]|nr:isoprenylcysteine carboxyl methyltransferase family protein [Actinocrinis sp.]